MIGRYATAVGVGAGVTFGLLFIMQLLIATGQNALTESENFRLGDFVRVERNEVIETKKEKPEKPPEPEEMPEMPAPDLANNFDNSMAVSVSAPQISTSMNVGGVGFGISDGEYLPIVKVAPVYPARALQRGLEGYVIVEFTVTPAGTTRDALVVESTSTLFERAALEAALKFKYKPRVIDGEAVEVPGVQNKISFEITK
ncbi:MAG: energy transducer TonB [Gammaproteobacteria bacterium]|mgnify:FL=1|nr:protein TonB [Gammaproteobacteria bacterium]MCH2668590.1 energy transducer TonB [Gammaproteobacteria bacterium]|tara:strand:+ start:760 stop:1359 length:600 start_codon:yes stop_codon:yes gene_type:complete